MKIISTVSGLFLLCAISLVSSSCGQLPDTGNAGGGSGSSAVTGGSEETGTVGFGFCPSDTQLQFTLGDDVDYMVLWLPGQTEQIMVKGQTLTTTADLQAYEFFYIVPISSIEGEHVVNMRHEGVAFEKIEVLQDFAPNCDHLDAYFDFEQMHTNFTNAPKLGDEDCPPSPGQCIQDCSCSENGDETNLSFSLRNGGTYHPELDAWYCMGTIFKVSGCSVK